MPLLGVGTAGHGQASGSTAPPSANGGVIPRGAVAVQIGAAPDSRPVPPGFVGLSIEYRSAPGYFGTPTDPDPVFDQLVRNLAPGQQPVLRIGGDTTDWTWAPTPGVAKPPGIQYTLGPQWMSSTAAAARALNARLILGVNFEADNRAIAGAESAALLRGVGRAHVAGLELGNEPELYGALGWFATPAGVPVPGRPSTYNFAAYLRDYARVSRALPRTVPLVGPASGAPQWLAGLGRYLAANPRVRLVTFHRYPLRRCFTAPQSPEFPTIANLLAPAAASGPATSVAAAVAAAHAHGTRFRTDELNSVSCGGARGVSDTFASALWVLDTLFNMARVGVDGVNIHTFHNAFYEPFAVSEDAGRWTAEVRPLYYGLLMFARAAPPGARLLPVADRGPRRRHQRLATGVCRRSHRPACPRRRYGHRDPPPRPARRRNHRCHHRGPIIRPQHRHRRSLGQRSHLHATRRKRPVRCAPAAGDCDAADDRRWSAAQPTGAAADLTRVVVGEI
jgi:hypothetical protein